MQIPSRCGWREDAAWGVATALAALLVLPLVPVAIAAGSVSEIVCRVREW